MMNYLLSPQQSDQNDQAVALDREPFSTSKVKKIVEAICADARKDALKYSIRSDTGHDGE